MTTHEKLRRRAEQATQPGPWKAIKDDDDRWRVVDANGMWVCDVGHDPHQARFIAAAYPESAIAPLDDLDQLRRDHADLLQRHARDHETALSDRAELERRLGESIDACRDVVRRANAIHDEVHENKLLLGHGIHEFLHYCIGASRDGWTSGPRALLDRICNPSGGDKAGGK